MTGAPVNLLRLHTYLRDMLDNLDAFDVTESVDPTEHHDHVAYTLERPGSAVSFTFSRTRRNPGWRP